MPGLVALAVVAAMLVVLVRAGRRKVKRSPPKPESFKEIQLQKFKQEDMKDIFLKQDCPVKVYSVAARLSASPPLEWIRTFEKEWRKVNANTEVRVYRDQVRFEADTRNVASIWSQLRATVNSVNCDYSQIVKKQNDALEKRQRDERDNAKEQRDIKWKTFKNLS
jgi:hypothetical protein